jgi:uncharacterized protein
VVSKAFCSCYRKLSEAAPKRLFCSSTTPATEPSTRLFQKDLMTASTLPFREQLSAFIREHARPVDKFGHQPRLYALTRSIGAGLSYDDDVVYAAAFLHDLGVFVGHRPELPEALANWDHVRYTLERTPAILTEAGFPAEKIAAVLQAIAQHQPHDTPLSLESTILRDADILEQLGAIGTLRAVSKVGRDTRFSTFSSAVGVLRGNLQRLPPLLRLPSARLLAEPRIRLLQHFLDAVEQEAGEHLH